MVDGLRWWLREISGKWAVEVDGRFHCVAKGPRCDSSRVGVSFDDVPVVRSRRLAYAPATCCDASGIEEGER